MEYPKTENLFTRDEKSKKVNLYQYRFPEFEAVNRWWVTEKIDGMNVRVSYDPALPSAMAPTTGGPFVHILGRTDNAVMPGGLKAYFEPRMEELLRECTRMFGSDRGIVYGEGYGPGIQKGGAYGPAVKFRAFDICRLHGSDRIWFKPQDVAGAAASLGLEAAPSFGIMNTEEVVAMVLVAKLYPEKYAKTARADGGLRFPFEGVVANSYPTLLDVYGNRIKFKLKVRDL